MFKIPSGLVSWWRFNDNKDFLEKNNGELKGNSQINDGSLILDGNENSYFDIGNDESLDMNQEFSASIWIKTNSNDGGIISKGDNYEIFLINGKIRFVSGGNSIESFNRINTNEWKHVVVSIDWKGVWKIFINKNLEAIYQSNLNPEINTEHVLLGKEFNGYIDDLMIFNKTLGIENIDFLYNHQKR